MKKIAIIGVLCMSLAVGVFIGYALMYPRHLRTWASQFGNATQQAPESTKSATIAHTPTKMQSIFIPYWQLGAWLNPTWLDGDQAAKRYIYFAIPTSKFGIDQDSDAGSAHVDDFLNQVPSGAKKELVVSMTSPDVNYEIFDSEEAQTTIIEQSVSMAREKGFDGVILDLEMPPLLSDQVPEHILRFTTEFSKGARQAGLKFSIILFGDSFYRARPFKVRELGALADEVYIMAYDFHKPNGTPGPNFPFEAGRDYSYDFQRMVTDFSVVIPKEKLTVIYGMYGYDWVVDIEKRPLRAASVLTNREIADLYESRCAALNCVITRHPQTKEEVIEFVDEDSAYHIIWHDDAESVARKTNYLNSQGISSVAYWAYGYY